MKDNKLLYVVEILTNCEMLVGELLVQGKSNREISKEFGISMGTVKNHLAHINVKLGAVNRVEAAALLVKLGMSKDKLVCDNRKSEDAKKS